MRWFQPECRSAWRAVALGCTLWLAGPAEAQMIVAHRGASEEAPENTLAAFRLAWELGADAIEGDFYLTRDGHMVAIHDETTQRTAGVDLRVADATLAQLQALDVGTWKADRFRGERIPTLEQVLALVPLGKKIFVEIKCTAEVVPKLHTILRESCVPLDQIVVISFHEVVITQCKQQMPQVPAYWLTGYTQQESTGTWSPSREEVLRILQRSGADGLDTEGNRQVVDRAFVEQLRARGLGFHVWTLDDPADARYFQHLGVDSITTNRPAAIRAALSRPAVGGVP
ncbi:MAG: glycerophosphodiester phosphodiesterase [Pirellulaceae bacterium]